MRRAQAARFQAGREGPVADESLQVGLKGIDECFLREGCRRTCQDQCEATATLTKLAWRKKD